VNSSAAITDSIGMTRYDMQAQYGGKKNREQLPVEN